jgi:hypothetical protein
VSGQPCAAERHGGAAAYRHHGCRCPQARAAHARGQREWRKRRYLEGGPLLVDATGTRRRLQALAAIGWPPRALAERLGIQPDNILRRHRVRVGTARLVAAVYDQLSMTPGPDTRSAAAARRRGWAPPLAWDDDSIDDPAARPHADGEGRAADDPVIDKVAVNRALADASLAGLTPAERVAAAARLASEGVTAPGAVAYRLGTSSAVAGRLLRVAAASHAPPGVLDNGQPVAS